jgi:hypothetical protein
MACHRTDKVDEVRTTRVVMIHNKQIMERQAPEDTLLALVA